MEMQNEARRSLKSLWTDTSAVWTCGRCTSTNWPVLATYKAFGESLLPYLRSQLTPIAGCSTVLSTRN